MSSTTSNQTDASFDGLKPGFTAYRCIRCGHLVGDPTTQAEWHGRCPPVDAGGCHKLTVFTKVHQ